MRLASLLTFDRGRSLFLPAHGRGCALPREMKALLSHRAGVWDLPELPDIGSTLERQGAVADSQSCSAKAFGVDNCWYGVNGATGLLQAAVLSVARPGESLLLPRNIHRSVIHACIIGDIKPVFFELPFLSDRGHFLPLDNDWLKDIFAGLDNIKRKIVGAILVNPTYNGYSGEMNSVLNLLHDKGLAVIVDEAHGCHYSVGVENHLPTSSLKAGADLVVHSLHKSASGLCQTAVLWSQGNRIDPLVISRCIDLLQTSSPSSLLLASCEATIRQWTSSSWKRRLIARIQEGKEMFNQLADFGLPLLVNQDPLRLLLHTSSIGVSGLDADVWFMSRGLVAELPEPGTLTFCLGFARHKGLTSRFKKLWTELLSNNSIEKKVFSFSPPPNQLVNFPEIDIGLAWRGKSKTIPLEEAAECIAAEMICPYPPGIPLVVPGEKLNTDRISWLIEQHALWPTLISNQIKVVI